MEQLIEDATGYCQGFPGPPEGYYLRNDPSERFLGQCGPFEIYALSYAPGTQERFCRLKGMGYSVDKRCKDMADFCQDLRNQEPVAIQELLSSGS